MRKAARRAAAEHQPDARPLRRRFGTRMRIRVHGLIAVLPVTPEKMKHATSPRFSGAIFHPLVPAGNAYAPIW